MSAPDSAGSHDGAGNGTGTGTGTIDALTGAEQGQPQRSWWRRNRIGLLAALLLIPITAGTTFWTEWTGFFSSQPTVAIDVERGVEASYDVAEWRLRDLQRYPATDSRVEDLDAPPGTDVVVALIGVDPDGEFPPSCSVRLAEMRGLSELRTWSDELDSYGVPMAEGIDTYCDREREDERGVQFVFVIPSDAGTELALLLHTGDGVPRYLRFHSE